VTEPLYEAAAMEILDGPNAAVRGLGRKSDLEGVKYLHVRDAEGTVLATVQRVEHLRLASRLLGGVFWLALGGGGSKVSKQRVVGAGGHELFTLEISGTMVIVKDPGGAPIALLSNESRAGGKVVDLKVYGPPRGKRYGFRRPGPPLLTVEEPQPLTPFDWAIQADGRRVARAANADDRRNVVTVLEPLDEQRRQLLAAFACSLIERRWTEIPPAPTGGD
jgi:hypothetical protein